jgi:hypothetical protein
MRFESCVAAVAPCELGPIAHPDTIQTPAVAFGIIGMCAVRRAALGREDVDAPLEFEDVVQLLDVVPFNISALSLTLRDSVDHFNQLAAVLAASQHHQMRIITLRGIPNALTYDDAVAFIDAVDGFRGIHALELEGDGVERFAATLGDSCSELRALVVKPMSATLPLLPVFIARCRGASHKDKLFGTRCVRKLLSIEDAPPIDAVLRSGLLPDLIKLCQDGASAIQFEAAWAITNIASGSAQQTNAVVEAGAVPMFVHLLRSPSADVVEQATWALGNIAGDSAELRDIVVGAGALECFTTLLQLPDVPTGQLRNGTWALSNLLRGSPKPDIERTRCAIPLLVQLLQSADDEVVMDAAWGLSYAAEANNGAAVLLAAGAAPHVVQRLSHHNASVVTPAIRTIGNFVTGTDLQTQAVLDAGALSHFTALMNHPKRGIRKEVCWTLSNITAGTAPQIQAVLDEGGGAMFLAVLAQCSATEGEVKKEALFAVANIGTTGTPAQAQSIARGALNALCAALTVSDARQLRFVLEGLDGYLKNWAPSAAGSEESNAHVEILMENGGLESLEVLQSHPDNNVYKLAKEMLETYFDVEEE